MKISIYAAFILGLLSSSCAPKQMAESRSDGVVVRILEACSDAATTSLRLQTEVSAEEWEKIVVLFSNPEAVFFETAINLEEDGHLFSSSSSGYRADPVIDDRTQSIRVDQEFIYPGSPSAESKMSIDASVSFSDSSQVIEVPDSFHVEFGVTNCK